MLTNATYLKTKQQQQTKTFKINSAHNYLSLPSCPVLLGSGRRTKVKLLLPPRNLQWILRRLPKCKSKNRILFGSRGKNCFLTGLRRLKGNYFLGFKLLYMTVLSLLNGVLLGTQSCSTSNVNFLKLRIAVPVISEPIISFKYNSDHVIA